MNKKTVQIITLIIIIMTAIGYYLYNSFVIPSLSNLETQQTTIMQLQDEYQKLQQYNKDSNYKQRLNDLNNKISNIDKWIPYEENNAEVIQYFYNSTKKYSVLGSNLSFEKVSIANKPYNTVAVNLSLKGTMVNLNHFLNEIQFYPYREMKIDSITFAPSDGGDTLLNLKILIFNQVDIKPDNTTKQ